MVAYVSALADDPLFYDHVSTALLSKGALLVDDGRLIAVLGERNEQALIYAYDPASADWEDWDRSGAVSADDSTVPDLRKFKGILIESRSPELVAHIGQVISAALSAGVWVVDSADVVWRADRIDPARIELG